MENFVPASPRQLWALYCITKTDYRDKNISRDEANRLIKELGNPEYKKKTKTPVSMKDEMIKYIEDNFSEIFTEVSKTLKARSTVSLDMGSKTKHYNFIGFGCGFVWLEYDKRSKIGKEIDKISHEIHRNEGLKLFLSQFTKTERKYYEEIGCPLEAIWQQDMNIKESYYHLIAQFGMSKGVKKMCYNSRLD
jgi:hypothetical protein